MTKRDPSAVPVSEAPTLPSRNVAGAGLARQGTARSRPPALDRAICCARDATCIPTCGFLLGEPSSKNPVRATPRASPRSESVRRLHHQAQLALFAGARRSRSLQRRPRACCPTPVSTGDLRPSRAALRRRACVSILSKAAAGAGRCPVALRARFRSCSRPLAFAAGLSARCRTTPHAYGLRA